MKFVYLVGVTNSGKDYFARTAMERHPKIFGVTNVGQIFRQRYPASRFRGQGAMADTEDEAYEIFCDEVARIENEGKQICLVNGQPRRVSQIDRVMKQGSEILWFHEPDEVLIARAKERDSCPEALNLSIERMTNDRLQLYDVLWNLRGQYPIHTANAQNMDGLIAALACFMTVFPFPTQGFDLNV